MFLNRFSILLFLVCVVQHCCVVSSTGPALTQLCGYSDGTGSYDFSGLRGQLLHTSDYLYDYYINICGVANVTAACVQENAMVCAVDKMHNTSIIKALLNNPPSWQSYPTGIMMSLYGEELNPIKCPAFPLKSTQIWIYCHPDAPKAAQFVQVTNFDCYSTIAIWHPSGCRLTNAAQPIYSSDDGASPVKIGGVIGIALGAVIALMILGYMIRIWCCKNGCHFGGKKYSYARQDDRAASPVNFVPMNAAAALQETNGVLV